MSEHDFEPIRGLPGPLPKGERILWQGSPDTGLLAREAFHLPLVAAYFVVMLAWRVASSIAAGRDPLHALVAAASVAPIALVALGIIWLLAWINSRGTVYTITTERVVMRFGTALPKAINIPFTVVEGAAVKRMSGGAGDLALTLAAPNKIAFLHLWPHARPWKLSAPQPTFRALRQVGEAADVLAGAMKARVGLQPAPIAAAPRERTPAGARPAGAVTA